MALHVLRKVKREVIRELTAVENVLYLDSDKDWYAEGYLDTEHPHHSDITKAIVDGTTGFALWSDGEGVVGTYNDLFSADFAKRNAKLTFKTQVEVGEMFDDEAPAPPARKGKAADVVLESGTAAS